MRVVITGASRGLGLEFVRQYLERGAVVEAAAREPNGAELSALAERYPRTLRRHRCEVTDAAGVAAFGAAVVGGGEGLDVLINNAGVGGQWDSLERMDFEDLARTMDVNAFGALRVTRALAPALERARGAVGNVSSLMGSIGDNRSGGAYAYRMSKAALNMASRCLALELQHVGIRVVALHPGWVQTDMGGEGAPTRVDESVRGMVRVMDDLRPEQAGRFIDFRGQELPW